MKREERLNFIVNLIENQEIKTQSELVTALFAQNVEVTQATVSRDIKNLSLIKIPASNGGARYALPEGKNKAKNQEIVSNMVLESLLELKISEQMIALEVKPGTTSLVKKELKKRYENLIFSVLTDDDSLLLIATNLKSAQQIYNDLK